MPVKKVRVFNPFRDMFVELCPSPVDIKLLKVTCEGIGFGVNKGGAKELAEALLEWAQSEERAGR